MSKTTMKLLKIELNDAGIKGFLSDENLRQTLFTPADDVQAAIPTSDGLPDAPRKKGQKQVHGRYAKIFQDRDAVAQDGRVAVDVGVEDADRGFFRLQTLQKAIISTGAKRRRKRKGKK